MIDTSQLITPASGEDDEALADSIEQYGQQRPILVAPDGSIVDGNRRLAACHRRGISPLIATLEEASTPFLVEAFALLHNIDSDRKPVPAERDRIVLALHEQGMSMREIVSATGVSRGTVERTVREASTGVPMGHLSMAPRRIDKRGRAQPTRKTTATEFVRRRDLVGDLYRRGHSTVEIAEALDVVIGTVRKHVRELGIADVKRYKGAGPITEPCRWRDDDVPPPPREARWRASRVVSMAAMLDAEYAEGNFANVLAGQATEALDAGDGAWIGEALSTIGAAIEKLERARRVLMEDNYRAACRNDHEGVEALRNAPPPLRAVQ